MYIPQPDWTKVYRTAKAIEEDLSEFKFLGGGWYETGTDTLLVHITDVGYYVSCWNFPGVRDMIAGALDQPVRVKGK